MKDSFSRVLDALRAASAALQVRYHFFRTGGLDLCAARLVNLQPHPGDACRLSGDAPDPQIHFQRLPLFAASGAALVEIDIEVLGEPLAVPVLYLGRHRSFREAERLPMVWTSAGRLAAYVTDIAHLDGLRFDPSEGPCDVRVTRARLSVTRDPALAARFAALTVAATSDGDAGADHRLVADHTTLDAVTIIGSGGVAPGESAGLFHFTDHDPQIIFALAPSGYGDGPLARLSFYMDAQAHPVFAPRVYLEYGDQGFSQESSFPLAIQSDSSCTALIALPQMITRIRWDPSDRMGSMQLNRVEARPASLSELAEREADKTTEPYLGLQSEAAAWNAIASELSLSLNANYLNGDVAASYDYARWLKAFETPTAADYAAMKAIIEGLGKRPTFSFVMPTYNTPIEFLDAAIRSMLDQVYPDFEICIADDCSTDPKVRTALERWAAADSRIRVTFRDTNGHISRASNSALALATGEFVVLMDHDDVVPDYALMVAAVFVDRRPNAKILFSDEDKLSPEGKRIDPYFKSDFNDFLMFGHNMISHLGIYQTALVRRVRGFRVGYEGSQDYDLFLRCSEKCAPSEIVHIPHVLYHWRMLPGSTAMSADQKSYAILAAQKALDAAFKRRGLPLKSADGVAPGLTRVEVLPPAESAKVSFVIPTRDGLDLLKPCLTSLKQAQDANSEVVIVDNGSVEVETTAFLAELAATPGFKVISAPGPFNFSDLCNLGVEAADGEIVCLLNNDTELLSPGWLGRARGLLSIPEVGAVGARLLYPDRTVQHFGLILGMGGHGIAGTPHRGLPEDEFGSFGKARLIQEFSAVTAACLFVRRADYFAVGGFDPSFAVAYNDVDFCLKLRARGLKVLCDPDILLIHKESKTRGADIDGGRAERLEREAALMIERWGATLAADPYYSPNLTLSRDDFSLSEAPRTALAWHARVDDAVGDQTIL